MDGLHGLVARKVPRFGPAFDSLVREHEVLLRQVGELEKAAGDGATDQAIAKVASLAEALRRHEAREDEIAKAALAEVMPPGT